MKTSAFLGLFLLHLTVLGQWLWGDAVVPTVTIVNLNDPLWAAEYTLVDTDLKTDVTTLTPNSYTKVYLPSPRHLQIVLHVPHPLFVSMVVTRQDFSLTPDMAGKTLLIRRSYEWATMNRLSLAPYQVDASELVYYPDLTGRLTSGGLMGPYERTFELMYLHPDQRIKIAEEAQGLNPDQSFVLYQRFQMNPRFPGFNLFPGYGVGSMLEGDWLVGGTIFGAEVLSGGLAAGFGLATIVPSLTIPFGGGSDRRGAENAPLYFATSLGVYLMVKVVAVIRANWYLEDSHKKLASALGVQKRGATP